MAKRAKYSGNQCSNCGRTCVPATDNEGQPYMGCPVCRVLTPPEAKPSRTSDLEAQLSLANAEISRLRLEVARLQLATPGGQAALREEILAYDFKDKAGG